MVPYDGSQKAVDYDLVILDGDAHSPKEVAALPLVDEAIDAGTSVLMVDTTGAHKREGLGEYLGFASKADSPAYLARLNYGENGRAEVRVIEFPSDVTPTFTELPAATPVSVSAPGAVKAFVDRALASIGDSSMSTQQGYSPYSCGGSPNTESLGVAQASRETIPSGAIYKHVYYCVPVSWQTGGTYNKSGSQNPYFDTNYTFTIILDNGDEPQGNFQFVAAQVDVSAVPNGNASGAQPILVNNNGERGWFQDRITLSLMPANGSLFSSVSDSPETANNIAQVTTGFSVGFAIQSNPNVTGSYSNSQTVTLPDWSVTNGSEGNAKAWNFKSTSPIDADNLKGGYTGFTGEVKGLNGLNMNQLQFHAQSAWKTSSVQNGWVDFNTHTVQNLADVAVVCDNSDPEFPTCNNKQETKSMGSQPTLSIYMGSVVPVPVQGITFSQNPIPVAASAQTTGMITLTASAPEDITIPLSSNNTTNAVVPPNVTVKQGETSATFPVTVTTNGGGEGTTFAVVISAFYAQNYQKSLNIKNIASTGLQPPTTAPGYDSQAWAQCVGTGGKWVAGYEVRYAATFVNASGETDRGPWSSWIAGTPYALPTLMNVPTDASGNATSRNVYRQFLADYSSGNPSAGVAMVGRLDDNTTARFADDDTTGTMFQSCPN